MATVSAEELNVQVERLYTGTDYFYACLVDTAGATVAAGTSLVDFLDYEQDPDVGGYLRKEFNYASTDINVYNSGVSVDAKRVTYTHDGTGPANTDWDVTHVVVVRAPLSKSQTNVKPILSTFDMSGSGVDIANDRINVSTITNFADGDPVVIKPDPSATLPAGIATGTKYYVKKDTGNFIKLATDVGLSTFVDITGVSSGAGNIQNAIGSIVGYYELPTSLSVSATQSVSYDLDFNQGQ